MPATLLAARLAFPSGGRAGEFVDSVPSGFAVVVGEPDKPYHIGELESSSALSILLSSALPKMWVIVRRFALEQLRCSLSREKRLAMLPNKSARGHANELFETAREMALICKTKANGQFNYRFLLQQQRFSTFNTLTKNILMRRNPC